MNALEPAIVHSSQHTNQRETQTMQTFNFSTGRNYETEQVLLIELSDYSDKGEIEFCSVKFTDNSRGISGYVSLMKFELDSTDYNIGQSVLREYDNGRYSPIK